MIGRRKRKGAAKDEPPPRPRDGQPSFIIFAFSFMPSKAACLPPISMHFPASSTIFQSWPL